MRYLALLAVLLTGISAAQNEPNLFIPDRKVVMPLAEMTDQLYADFRQGRLGDVVVRVDEGSILKMHFVMLGDTLALENSPPMKVKVLRTLYLRVLGEELQFSLDCGNWGTPPQIFRSNLAMMIDVNHNVPTGAFALFLTGR